MSEKKPVEIFEKKRIYTFPNEDKVILENVTELLVRDSGSHRIKTVNGEETRLHIIPVGWIHIEIDATNWTL